MEIVLLYGGLTSDRRFVFEPRWVTLFSQSLFFITFLFKEGWRGEIFVWFLHGTSHIYARVLVSSWWAMCRCKLHHSIYSWKMVVQTDHTYYCFVQVQTSLQAELIIDIKSFTSHRNKVWSCLTFSDFFWYIIVCTCSGGHNCNNLYMCVCRYCMSFHTSHQFLFLDYLSHLSGSTPSN